MIDVRKMVFNFVGKVIEILLQWRGGSYLNANAEDLSLLEGFSGIHASIVEQLVQPGL